MKIVNQLFFLALGFSSIAYSKLPPSPFKDVGACPFECCRYGDWTAKEDIELKDQINGRSIVGKIKHGEKIKALNGEVHTIPNVVEVIRDHDKFKRGEIFYLLTYQGEGFYKVWRNGVIASEEILFPSFTALYDFKNCDSTKIDCWGKITNLKRVSTWWVKIKMANGTTGWTNLSKEFSGQDSCS